MYHEANRIARHNKEKQAAASGKESSCLQRGSNYKFRFNLAVGDGEDDRIGVDGFIFRSTISKSMRNWPSPISVSSKVVFSVTVKVSISTGVKSSSPEIVEA